MSLGSVIKGLFTNAKGTTASGSITSANVDANTQAMHVSLTNSNLPQSLNSTISGTLTSSDAIVAAPLGDGTIVSGASTSGSIVYSFVPDGFSAWTLMVKGYVSGTIYTESSNNTTDGIDGDWVEVKGRRTGTAVGIESTTSSIVANGYYRGNASGFKAIRARLIGGAGPTIQWTLSSGQGATFLNSGLPTGSSNIGTVGLTSSGVVIGARSDGFLGTYSDPTTLLFDTFETIDTTNTWTLGGTSPSGVNGVLTINAGSTANAKSYASSKPAFTPGSSALLQFASIVSIQAGVVTGANQFFGLGVLATPTVSVPITNGAIFEIDTTGALLGSIYSAGVRTQTVNLVRPTDGLVHRYAIYYKASRVAFEIDSVYVGSLAFPNPVVAALNIVIGQANGASVTGAPSLTASLLGIGDTGRNAVKLADGLLPWRTVSIGSSGGLSVRGASMVPVSGSIAVAGTGIVGPMNVSEAGNVTFTVKNTTPASAYAGAPVIVFEQSDDNINWGPLAVTRADTGVTSSTSVLPANTANGSLMFDGAMEGVNYVRARVTTGPTTNALTVAISAGGFPFSPSVSLTGPVPIGTNKIGTVDIATAPATAKATQGAAFLPTQDAKDSGRVGVTITCYRAAGIAGTEALFAAATFARSLDAATATTGVQFTVTAGKRFRIQAVEVSVYGNAAAVVTSKLALRAIAAAGTITNASPVLAMWDVGSNVATTGNYIGPMVMPIPDGMEILGGYAFGFTNLSSATTNLHTITLIGYEY